MATRLTEVLNADAMSLGIYCGGQSKVGINLSGTWAGTVRFFGSTDGINFIPLSVTPFASGTTVQSATANGNWEVLVQNYVVIKAVFSRTSGSVVVVLSASIDSSYQDAFLASTSRFVAQEITAGAANAITQAAQANRAWRLRTLTGACSAAPGAAVKVTVTDGASSLLWESYIAASAGPFAVTLPADPNTPGVSGGGVVGTPGNSMVVTLAAPGGSVVSSLNCEFIPA